MRKIMPRCSLPILMTAAAAFLAAESRGACEACPKRAISAFDFNVTVPRPAQPNEMGPWYNLFFAAGGALNALADDASASCVDFFDGVLVQSGRAADSLSFGTASAHTAPAGAIGGTDYILTGSVSGSYAVEAQLQASCSREIVATGTKAFAAARDALASGRAAGQSLNPISTTLSDFEKRKRVEDVKVARNVEEIKVIPSKTKAARDENVPVDIIVTDCDGTPLAGRTVTLVESNFHGALLNGSELGAFTAATAITDAAGKAQAVFRTGPAKGTAIARAYFIHKSPMGCDKVGGGAGFIQIEDPILPAYVIHAEYTYVETSRRDTTHEISMEGTYSRADQHDRGRVRRTMAMTAVCVNDGADENHVDLTSGRASVRGATSSTFMRQTYDYGKVPGKVGYRSYYSVNREEGDVIFGPAGENSEVTFHFDPAHPESNHFLMSGTIFNRRRSDTWIYDSETGSATDHRDTTEVLNAYVSIGIPWEAGRGSFTVVDSGFAVTLRHDTAYTDPTGGNSTHHTLSITLKATVRPLSEYLTTRVIPRRPSAHRKPPAWDPSSRWHDVLGRWSGAAARRPTQLAFRR